mgnify:CR=1 FL=1
MNKYSVIYADPNTEHYQSVPGFEDTYEVSDQGHVRRIHGCKGWGSGYVLSGVPDGKVYLRVKLFNTSHPNGQRYRIHVLVASVFIGPKLPGTEVNHKDGNKRRNDVNNLEYTTPSENMRHAYATGLKSPVRPYKLQPEHIRNIRVLRSLGITAKSLAEEYRVCVATIHRIWNGSAYGGIV